MNEKIEKLVACIPTDTSGRWVYIGDMEKFAELVVRECSYLADQAHKKATGGKSAGGYIREHFGVEE